MSELSYGSGLGNKLITWLRLANQMVRNPITVLQFSPTSDTFSVLVRAYSVMHSDQSRAKKIFAGLCGLITEFSEPIITLEMQYLIIKNCSLWWRWLVVEVASGRGG